MSFHDAHAFAFSFATTLMAVIVIFRAGDEIRGFFGSAITTRASIKPIALIEESTWA